MLLIPGTETLQLEPRSTWSGTEAQHPFRLKLSELRVVPDWTVFALPSPA